MQFAFFNLITWAPWMVLGPVLGRAYLGGAAVWGAIMGIFPGRPMNPSVNACCPLISSGD